MSERQYPALFWTSRGIPILMALFLATLALDAWNPNASIWVSMLGYLIHLIPSFLLAAITIVSWNRTRRGEILFLLSAIIMTIAQIRNAPENLFLNVLVLAGPLYLTAYLFFCEDIMARSG